MKVNVKYSNSIEQKQLEADYVLPALTPEAVAAMMKELHRLECIKEENDPLVVPAAEFHCVALVAIYEDSEYYFVVRSEDLVVCYEVGYINVRDLFAS